MEEVEEENSSLPLNVGWVEQPRAKINRVYMLIRGLGILSLLYYRASRIVSPRPVGVTLAWYLLFSSELLLSFLWLLGQAFRWRPFSRTVFTERLPDDTKLPAIDVFICTTDPKKEPPIGVMNTVLSAMSLDYPSEKLAVYLSDDAGSPLTLYALRQAFSFAGSWLPFCQKNGIQSRCPEAYFSKLRDEDRCHNNDEFMEEREKIKLMYEAFKNRVERAEEKGMINDKTPIYGEGSTQDHPPLIEVMRSEGMDGSNGNQPNMPTLVYVAREKRQTHPHHFKAGALNVLLRVSNMMTNAPYILVLDCDMYSNSPISAREAMCFHLDPNISHSLAFVQFSHTFHNISKNDIYDAQLRSFYKIYWNGADGLKGPILSGAGFYIKREALYGSRPGYSKRQVEADSIDLLELRRYFGPSNGLIATIRETNQRIIQNGIVSITLLQEATTLTSCTYEKDTQWGEEIGFLYHSLVEDFFTGFHLHCRGWKSLYYYPSRPSFLCSAVINLNDNLVQYKRWASGLVEVGFSRLGPLAYGLSRKLILQNMCYGFLALEPLNSLPVLLYTTIPQICLLNNISLFPKVSNVWFLVFLITFISSLYQHFSEVISCGGCIKMWWIEQRIWMIRALTSNAFGCLDVIMKVVGIQNVDFHLTNKVIKKEQIERYEKGLFNFEGATLILVPLVTIIIINMASFIGGIIRVVVEKSLDEMFVQVLLSFVISLLSYPIFEGILIRKDKGRVPTMITLLSVMFSMIILSLGSIIF